MNAAAEAPVKSRAELSRRWCKSIDEITQDDWDTCFPEQEVLRSYSMQKAYERSNFEGVEYRYLLITDTSLGQVIAIFPCFFFNVSLTDVAPKSIQALVNKVRGFWAGFLKVRALVCGSPIAICDDLFGVSEQCRPMIDDIIQFALEAIEGLGATSKSDLIIVKEVRSRYRDVLLGPLQDSYVIAESPPTCFAYVGPKSGEDYLKSFRNKYRSNIKGYLNKFNKSGLRWQLVEDFSSYADTMCSLYLNVLENSSVKFETLTPDFFRAVNDLLGDCSTALLCFKGDEIVAMELIVQDHNMHPIYLGMDYRYLKDSGLYFNCLIRLLNEAEQRGSYSLELGQTSYDAKSNFGIRVEKLYVAIKARNGLVGYLLKYFKNSLFPQAPTVRQRNLFKQAEEHERLLDKCVDIDRNGYFAGSMPRSEGANDS